MPPLSDGRRGRYAEPLCASPDCRQRDDCPQFAGHEWFRQGRSKLSFRQILLGGLSVMLTDQGNALMDLWRRVVLGARSLSLDSSLSFFPKGYTRCPSDTLQSRRTGSEVRGSCSTGGTLVGRHASEVNCESRYIFADPSTWS